MTAFSMSFDSLPELIVAAKAVEDHRRGGHVTAESFPDSQTHEPKPNGRDTERRAALIYDGLTYRPLNSTQEETLRAWHVAERSLWTSVGSLQEIFVSKGLASNQEDAKHKVRGALAGLALRMSKKMSSQASGIHHPPLSILVEIRYDDFGSASHRLTEEGRRAVQRLFA